MSHPQPVEQTILVMRHATRIDMVDKSWKKSAPRPFDPYLAEQGMTERAMLTQRLLKEPFEEIYCSPFLRTVQTVYPLAEQRGIPIRLEPGYSEWLQPKWFSEVPRLLPEAESEIGERLELIDRSYTSPVQLTHLENLEDIRRRVTETTLRLAATGKNLLIVGHGGSIRFCVATLRGVSFDDVTPSSPASIYKLVRRGSQWISEYEADQSCYLGDPQSASAW